MQNLKHPPVPYKIARAIPVDPAVRRIHKNINAVYTNYYISVMADVNPESYTEYGDMDQEKDPCPV